MPAIELFQDPKHLLYEVADLIRLRRTTLRTARSLPIGSERNQQRQIAASLGRLIRDDVWLEAHTRPNRQFRSGRSWQVIETAPFNLPLELAVFDEEGPHLVVFPCQRVDGGWSDAKSGTNVFVHPTFWREWRHLS